jgi:hypothetical protein
MTKLIAKQLVVGAAKKPMQWQELELASAAAYASEY